MCPWLVIVGELLVITFINRAGLPRLHFAFALPGLKLLCLFMCLCNCDGFSSWMLLSVCQSTFLSVFLSVAAFLQLCLQSAEFLIRAGIVL